MWGRPDSRERGAEWGLRCSQKPCNPLTPTLSPKGEREPTELAERVVSFKLDWAPIWDNRDLLVEGFVTTIMLSVLGLVLALVIGVLVGTAGTSKARLLRAGAAAYVELMRNIPLLVHMYFWYMGLAFLRLPPFACAVAALALYSGAYVSEIVRSGIGAVPQGQRLAALATGLTPLQGFVLVVYPQALRIITPSLASLFSQLIKDFLAGVRDHGRRADLPGELDRGTDVPHLRGLHHDLAPLPAAGLGRDLWVAARSGRARRRRAEGERCLRSSSRTSRSC